MRRRIVAAAIAGIGFFSQAFEQQPSSPGLSPMPDAGSPQEAVQRGERAFADFQWEEVVTLMTGAIAALGEHPSDPGSLELLCRAYDKRAQAYLNMDNEKSAVADFERLVRANPAYQLDPDTSSKFVQLFRKIRDPLVGTLSVTCTPEDAQILLDGEPRGACPLAECPVLAGEHTLRGARRGFDTAEMAVTIAAGERKPVHLSLAPNARSINLQTKPSGVEILVDGKLEGITAPGPHGEEGESLPLMVEAVSPGDHLVLFRKPCWSTVRHSIMVVLDLDDLTPERFDLVEMTPTHGGISVDSVPRGATVSLDGAPIGSAPLVKEPICPGEYAVEVTFAPGIRWREKIVLGEDEKADLVARPRPDLNWHLVADPAPAVSVSTPDPEAGLSRLRERILALKNFNLLERAEVPAQATPGASAAPALNLIGRISGDGVSHRVRFSISSSFSSRAEESKEWDLDAVADWGGFLGSFDVPTSFEAASAGVVLLDTLMTTGPVVLAVRTGSPGEMSGLQAGDLIVSLDRQKAPDAARAREILNRPGRTDSLLVEVQRSSGSSTHTIAPAPYPTLIPLDASEGKFLSYHRAAADSWIEAGMAPDGPRHSVALLNLAAALIHLKEFPRALKDGLSQGSALPEGPGISLGTMLYLKGIALESIEGRTSEASAAFRAAAESPEATLEYLDDVPLASGARARAEALNGSAAAPAPSSSPAARPPGSPRPGGRSGAP